jgi:hypothetical protein
MLIEVDVDFAEKDEQKIIKYIERAITEFGNEQSVNGDFGLSEIDVNSVTIKELK